LPLLIKNGTVFDGEREGRACDILVAEGTIAKTGRNLPANGATVLDAEGHIVCPGFVDIHRHTDTKAYTGWDGGEMLRQGISTCICGNCGFSLAPATDAQLAFSAPILGNPPENPPGTFADFLDGVKRHPLPVNLGALIGTGAVRIAVKGFSQAPFTPNEMDTAVRMIDDALCAGAFGASVGIMYIPECYGTKAEFAKLLSPLGRRGALLAAHIRGEGDSLVSSVREVLEIADDVGCSLEISHFKACGASNWRKSIHQAIEEIERARAKGQDVTCDFYPYDGGSTALSTMLPPDFVGGDMEGALTRLGTKEGVAHLRSALEKTYPAWDNFALTLGWERILIASVSDAENRRFLGMRVTDAAAKYGFDDAAALAAHLLHTDRGKTAVINLSMCQDDIDTVAKLPYSHVISDAIYAETDTPHPRMFGAMPRFWQDYVVQRHILTEREAIAKMTRNPALRMGIADRGILAPGARADILVFQRDCLRDNATYAAPARASEGVKWLIVNGEIAVENDAIVRHDLGQLCLREA
jgi:N-acyl-D-amino-acid deacylase